MQKGFKKVPGQAAGLPSTGAEPRNKPEAQPEISRWAMPNPTARQHASIWFAPSAAWFFIAPCSPTRPTSLIPRRLLCSPIHRPPLFPAASSEVAIHLARFVHRLSVLDECPHGHRVEIFAAIE